jgi:calpain
MVAMLDLDHSGKLGLEEFTVLVHDVTRWKVSSDLGHGYHHGSSQFNYHHQNHHQKKSTFINHFQTVFRQFDKDETNTLDAHELRAALLSAGYYPNNRVLNSMIYRYGSNDNTLAFDDFIMCAVKMKATIEFFKTMDQKQLRFSMDEWIARSLYS